MTNPVHEDPEGCSYCGALAGACSVYPHCPGGPVADASPVPNMVSVPRPRIPKEVILLVGKRLRVAYSGRFILAAPVQHTDIERQVILSALDTLISTTEGPR